MSATAALRQIAARVAERAPVPAARLRAWADTLDRAPEARRAAILAAVTTAEPALAHLAEGRPEESLRDATPYVGLDVPTAARLVLGESPAQISGGLTRAEAHQWLTARSRGLHQTPAEWLLVEHGVTVRGRESITTVAVARWLCDRWRDPAQREALTRARAEVMAGQRIEGSYLDRADELRPRDLRPSVEDTYRVLAKRLTAALERALASKGEPLCGVPRWWRPARCARLLRTGPDLVAEGQGMHHCVATYADAVRSQRSVIVGLAVLGQRSTAELDPETIALRQHKGRGNTAPPALCERALDVLRRRGCAAAGVTP